MFSPSNSTSPRHPLSVLGSLLIAFFFVFTSLGCSDEEVAGNTTCSTDRDCELGTVCTAQNVCDYVDCQYCSPEDHVCLITDERPEGSCSLPECVLNEDCPDGEPCVEGICGGSIPECTNNDQCPGTQVCNFANRCVDGEGGDDDCASNDDCSGNQVCDTTSGQCIDPGSDNCNDDPDLCADNEYCADNGECRTNNCGDLSPSDCTGLTPVFDGPNCQCVACLDASNCAPGQICNNGTCEDTQSGGCQISCDPNTPGICSGTGTPYCINECCVECLGAADCGGGEICLDGFCGLPPDCSTDPSVCPTGYECNAQGECAAPQTGQSCDPSDPSSCPVGTFCDPETSQCGGLGGDLGCGFCNEDCTCDGGLTCNGFACEGCTMFSSDCPTGQFCLTGICVPNPF